MVKTHTFALLFLILLALAASACSPAPEPTAVPTQTSAPLQVAPTQTPTIPGDAAAGKVVFEQYCQECHSTEEGVALEGPSMYGAGRRMTLMYAKNSIIDPKGNTIISSETDKAEESSMHEGYGDELTEKELEDVIAFILSFR